MFSISTGFSESAREVMQEFLDTTYQDFVNKVAQGRSLEYDAVHEVAQGRIWTGTQALERNLVDELGGLEEAVAKAVELASLEDAGIKRLPRQKTFFEVMMEDLGSVSVAEPSVRLELPGVLDVQEEALRDLLLLEQMLSDGGVAAVVPGNLKVR